MRTLTYRLAVSVALALVWAPAASAEEAEPATPANAEATAGEETPAHAAPADETPAQEAPVDGTPAGEQPVAEPEPPAPATAPLEEPGAIRVAVLQLKAGDEMPEETVNALGDLVANSIDSLGDFQIIGSSDVEALIGFEATKQLVGCDDASCLAEMSGALGVRYLVSGSVARIGTAWLINLRLIDLDRAEVSSRASGKTAGGDEKVIDAIPPLVTELFAPITDNAPADKPREGAWARPDSQLRLLAAGEAMLAYGKREFLDITDAADGTRDRTKVGERDGLQYGGGVKLALVLWGPWSTELVFGVRAGGGREMVYVEPLFELDIAPIKGTNVGFLVGFGWHVAWEQHNDNWYQGDGFGLSPNRFSVGLDWEPNSWLRIAFEGGVIYYSNDATKLVSHGTEGLLVPHLTLSTALIPLRYD